MSEQDYFEQFVGDITGEDFFSVRHAEWEELMEDYRRHKEKFNEEVFKILTGDTSTTRYSEPPITYADFYIKTNLKSPFKQDE